MIDRLGLESGACCPLGIGQYRSVIQVKADARVIASAKAEIFLW